MVAIMIENTHLINLLIELQYVIYCSMFMPYCNNIFNLGRKLTWIQIWFSFQVLLIIQSANREWTILTPPSHLAEMGK